MFISAAENVEIIKMLKDYKPKKIDTSDKIDVLNAVTAANNTVASTTSVSKIIPKSESKPKSKLMTILFCVAVFLLALVFVAVFFYTHKNH